MSEQHDEPTAAQLLARMDELGRAVAELKAAQTPAERREAREDVDEAEEALARYAKAHGLTVDQAADAIEAVKTQQETSRLRGIVKGILEEDYKIKQREDGDDDEDDDSDNGGGGTEDRKKKPAPKAVPKPDEAPGEQDGHWTDRKVSELLR